MPSVFGRVEIAERREIVAQENANSFRPVGQSVLLAAKGTEPDNQITRKPEVDGFAVSLERRPLDEKAPARKRRWLDRRNLPSAGDRATAKISTRT